MNAPDPLLAVLEQLDACCEQLASLDSRESGHYAELNGQLTQLAGMVTTIRHALAEDTNAFARLAGLDQEVAELKERIDRTSPDEDGDEDEDDQGYKPRPAPSWWKLAAADRTAPLTELRDWTDRIYRPGYGHLAAPLAPCWPEHELCLYALDIASQLWCVLYLQPNRTTRLLSAQAEYQVRILPAIAAQLAAETTRCARQPGTHHRSTP